MTQWDSWEDEAIQTPKGKKALAKLREADVLFLDALRIKQAVRDGLLPRVTLADADRIAERVEHMGDSAARQIDLAEGWTY